MKRSIQVLTLTALMAAGQLASADVISPLPAGGEGGDNLVPVEENYGDRRVHGGSIVGWGVSKAQHRGERFSSTRRFIDD